MTTHIATAALVRDGRVLLVHRHPLREHYADRWALVGGHVEPGETPEAAVRRECREELGVDIVAYAPYPIAVDDPALRTSAFLVTGWRGEPANTAPEEHDDLRWFTAAEIADLDLAHPETRARLQAAIADGAARTP
ncbi:NUDIX domain-containing protein [Luteipulveratus halotolerans]|uniref:Acetyltransferase n=1 Tax=Luteipulveratus halotolerans TaxID=1631356 RepID=A0A0L6CP05_9MICO|nr:NUDIX domain-containing protein [Luteipulveratus halotolerans]KNX39484.1 acetyltransferase [Luteipulveratus halotolerans]